MRACDQPVQLIERAEFAVEEELPHESGDIAWNCPRHDQGHPPESLEADCRVVERKRSQHPEGKKKRYADGDEEKRPAQHDEKVRVEGLEQALVVGKSYEAVVAGVVKGFGRGHG